MPYQEARSTSNVPRYAYNRLTASEKELYNQLFQGLMRMDTEISFLTKPRMATLEKAIRYLLLDYPEIDWFRAGYSYYTERSSDLILMIRPKYCMTLNEKIRREALIQREAAKLIRGISPWTDDFDAALLLFHRIINLSDYDSLGLEREVKLSSDKPDDLRSIYGLLVNHRAVCAGYAKTYQYLLRLVGIESITVSGIGKREAHQWNLVRLGKDYYYTDITWDEHSYFPKKAIVPITALHMIIFVSQRKRCRRIIIRITRSRCRSVSPHAATIIIARDWCSTAMI